MLVIAGLCSLHREVSRNRQGIASGLVNTRGRLRAAVLLVVLCVCVITRSCQRHGCRMDGAWQPPLSQHVPYEKVRNLQGHDLLNSGRTLWFRDLSYSLEQFGGVKSG